MCIRPYSNKHGSKILVATEFITFRLGQNFYFSTSSTYVHILQTNDLKYIVDELSLDY